MNHHPPCSWYRGQNWFLSRMGQGQVSARPLFLLLVMWERFYVIHKAHFVVSFSYWGRVNQVVCGSGCLSAVVHMTKGVLLDLPMFALTS